ncbi:MAG: MlaA family lipoprotein, partial [Bdellovibrionales bacterium]
NAAVDENVIHPVLKGYRAVTPEGVRSGVHNFLTNLKSPVVIVNQVLQGDIDGAGTALFRVTVNTLAGFGGILDVAAREGIAYEPEDFGQTLAVWGLDHGPYLVVPILGPSSMRDYAGYIVDAFADPLRWYLFDHDHDGLYYAKTALTYMDLRNELMDVLEELEKSSIDYYAATRSVYYQNRDAMVNDLGDGVGFAAIPDYDE